MCFARTRALAQGVPNEFLPQVDVYYRFNTHVQVYVQAKDDREGGEQQQATIGPSLQVFHKPLWSLKRLVFFDLDATKSAPWVFESGYRAITTPDGPVKNRLFEAVTLRFPLLNGLAVGNRDLVDLDWQNGAFTWRFRNRLTIARMFTIRSFHFAPYLACEPFYLSKSGKFAVTDTYGGMDIPAGNHLEFNIYYEHENNTEKSPNSQQNYIGLQMQLFFPGKQPVVKAPDKRTAGGVTHERSNQ